MLIPSFRFFPFCLFIVLVSSSFTVAGQQSKPDTVITLYDTLVSELDEVVITGTRISRKIIDIPYPVVRLNQMNYRYGRKSGADDLLGPVPGLFLQSRYGNHDVRFSIRGFGSRSNSGIRGVRILVDDIPESEPDGQTRIEAIDFNAVGTIEIARGNASSLYTNAPGGVVNFTNDIGFHRSHVTQFNQFGSFGLQRNGIKAAVRTKNYGLLTTYSRQRYEGYRAHNQEDWHILNLVLETKPGKHSSLKILGYFVDGQIRLPGALTKEEFEADPYMADPRSVDRDQKRISTKGRLGIRYHTAFGQKLNNEIEVTTYGTIKYFERTSREYRIINRYGLGLRASYINRSNPWNHTNEFVVGTDLLLQPARTEYYDNIAGIKGDQLNQLTDEKISNTGFYISNNYELFTEKLFLLFSARYDHITFDLSEETLPSREDQKTFQAITPKLALNYRLSRWISVYSSFGLSFDSPAKNELESLDPTYLYNQDLKAQESRNYELGIKGNLLNSEADLFRKVWFEATIFYIDVKNEIVPLEVFGDVFFRNAANTTRTGIELGNQTEIYKGLTFNFSYTWSDFQYQSYQAKTIEVDSTGAIAEKQQDFSGNVVPSVPEHNLYLALAYAHPIANNLDGFVRVSQQAISGIWVDDANSEQTARYTLLNGVIGLDATWQGFNVMISGGINNLFDEVYAGFTNTNSADLRFYEAGAPRNHFIALNIGYTF